MMKVIIAGQKWFGAEVFRLITHEFSDKIEIVAVCAPFAGDRLTDIARTFEVPVIPAGTLTASKIPPGVDLGIAAHSHDYIGRVTRYRCRLGWIGYHPSLLPIHRGRDAVKWAIKMGDRITGGTVYWLNNTVDGGDILCQKHVFVRREDTAETLWRRDLAPLGIELMAEGLDNIVNGKIIKIPQDPKLSSWEPALNPPPLKRPDLLMLNEYNNGQEKI